MSSTWLSINVIKMRKRPNLSHRKSKISNSTKLTVKKKEKQKNAEEEEEEEDEDLKYLGIRVHDEIRYTVAVFGIEFSVQFETASPPWTRPMYWE